MTTRWFAAAEGTRTSRVAIARLRHDDSPLQPVDVLCTTASMSATHRLDYRHRQGTTAASLTATHGLSPTSVRASCTSLVPTGPHPLNELRRCRRQRRPRHIPNRSCPAFTAHSGRHVRTCRHSPRLPLPPAADRSTPGTRLRRAPPFPQRKLPQFRPTGVTAWTD
jgi:hypothetical protein